MIIICITLIIIHCFLRDFIAFIIFFPAEERKYNKMMFITIYNITNVVCVIIPMFFACPASSMFTQNSHSKIVTISFSCV